MEINKHNKTWKLLKKCTNKREKTYDVHDNVDYKRQRNKLLEDHPFKFCIFYITISTKVINIIF